MDMGFSKKSGGEEGWKNQQAQKELFALEDHGHFQQTMERKEHTLHNFVLITDYKLGFNLSQKHFLKQK